MIKTVIKGTLLATGTAVVLVGSLMGLAWLETHPVSEAYFAVEKKPAVREVHRAQLAKYQAVAKQEPTNADAWGWIGLCQSRLGENEAALKAYKTASSLRDAPQFDLTALSVLYARLGRDEDAIQVGQQLVKRTPDDPHALRRLADAYTRSGRVQEAEEVYTKALAQKPKSAKIYFGLGRFQWKLGRYSTGLQSYGTGALMLFSGRK